MRDPIVTERDCAGQAVVIRNLKARLDKAMAEEGPINTSLARDLALSLAGEIKAFQILCTACMGKIENAA